MVTHDCETATVFGNIKVTKQYCRDSKYTAVMTCTPRVTQAVLRHTNPLLNTTNLSGKLNSLQLLLGVKPDPQIVRPLGYRDAIVHHLDHQAVCLYGQHNLQIACEQPRPSIRPKNNVAETQLCISQ